MRVAYLILAYKHPNQLGRLVRRLIHEEARFYIHIDKRSDISEFREDLSRIKRLTEMTLLPRVNSDWGGPGLVIAILHGLSRIVGDGNSGRIVLLSGLDYPIKPTYAVLDFFAKNQDKNYLPFFELPYDKWWRGGLPRIENYHFKILGRRIVYPPYEEPVRWSSKAFYRSLGVFFRTPRAFPYGLKPYGGFSGWKITGDAAKEVLDFVGKRPDYLRFHKYSYCVDEVFFQTILLNSGNRSLRDSIVNDDLTYINWKESSRSPEILTTSDFSSLERSDHLFARKFDYRIDSQILDRIDRELLSKGQGNCGDPG